MTVTLYLIY